MSKFDLKLKAIKLRKSGKTYREICAVLPVSKSTVSLWCRAIVLTEHQQEVIFNKMKKNGKIGVIKAAQTNRNKKIKSQKIASDWAINKIGTISLRDKLITGVSLYWAEGSKADSTTGFIFVNSDSAMIKFMYEWLVNIIKIPKIDIVAKISIHEVHKYRIKKVLNFWSNLLDLPRNQFSSAFFQKTVQKKVYDNHDVHYGVLRLGVRRSTFLKYQTLALIRTLRAGVAQVVRANAS